MAETSPSPDPKTDDLCNSCHHRKSLHVPVCCDPMLGSGRWCDCEEFVAAPTEQQKETTDEVADPAPEGAREVRRPAVRPPAS